MKNIVLADHYSQNDLKPTNLINQYVQLLTKDVRTFLVQGQDLSVCVCPGCSVGKNKIAFNKCDLTYHECLNCATLYVSKRPSDKAINNFYTQATSRAFWREQLSEVTRNERREKIIKPRFEWVLDSTSEYCSGAAHWLDLHSSQYRYLEAMSAEKLFPNKTALHPYFNVDRHKVPSVAVITQPWWEAVWPSDVDVITAFEVLDHTADVNALLCKIHSQLKPKGLCFITAILSSGFDVRILGEYARNIFPPDRLNVFSVKGLKDLVLRHGFECIELSTPGILDVDIVATSLKEENNIPMSGFLRDLVLNGSDDVRGAFQDFLQANLLSSYGRILIRKV